LTFKEYYEAVINTEEYGKIVKLSLDSEMNLLYYFNKSCETFFTEMAPYLLTEKKGSPNENRLRELLFNLVFYPKTIYETQRYKNKIVVEKGKEIVVERPTIKNGKLKGVNTQFKGADGVDRLSIFLEKQIFEEQFKIKSTRGNTPVVYFSFAKIFSHIKTARLADNPFFRYYFIFKPIAIYGGDKQPLTKNLKLSEIKLCEDISSEQKFFRLIAQAFFASFNERKLILQRYGDGKHSLTKDCDLDFGLKLREHNKNNLLTNKLMNEHFEKTQNWIDKKKQEYIREVSSIMEGEFPYQPSPQEEKEDQERIGELKKMLKSYKEQK